MAGVQTAAMRTGDPTASFTDGQWYCYQARQSVYFAAYAKTHFTDESLTAFAHELFAHAPQLIDGFAKDSDGTALHPDLLRPLLSIAQVKTLKDFPDSWDMSAEPFYERPDLPMVRLRVVNAETADNPDAPHAMLCVLSTHALFEGADSADLSRSAQADHAAIADHTRDLPAWRRRLIRIAAALMAPVQIVLGYFLADKTPNHQFRTLALPRHRIRRLANHYGVGQRALVFALVAMALNGKDKIISKRRIFVTYTELDERSSDGFFRFRMMEAKFPVVDEFAHFAKAIEAKMAKLATTDPHASQAFISGLFAAHRWLKARLPFLYLDRLFRFTGFYDLDLSMTPPHRLQGQLAKHLLEPVYCGTQHPGLNACIFAPQKGWITLNFNMKPHLIARVPAVMDLLKTIDPDASATAKDPQQR